MRFSIVDADVTSFRWTFARRIANANRSWALREALLVRLRTDDGAVGWGEAAPLPGFSPDDLTTCRRELEAARSSLLRRSFSADDSIEESLSRATEGLRCPSAIFAIETGLLDAIGKVRGEPASVVLQTRRRELPIAAILLETERDALVREAVAASGRGIAVAKLKIGGTAARARDEEHLRALEAPRRELGLALRLDANQSLDRQTVAEDLAALAAFGPELLEEPVRGADWLEIREAPLPLAMDESLLEPDAEAILRTCAARKTCAALVLKPMVLGLVRTLNLARLAQELGLSVIVTHLFDGPVAAAATAEIALAVPGDVRAAGLDSFGRAEDWPASCTPEQVGPSHLRPGQRPGLGVDPLVADIVGAEERQTKRRDS